MADKSSTTLRVTATEAAKNFGELVNRVRETGATYVVERGGTPVVQVSPVNNRRCRLSDLAAALEAQPGADRELLAAIERGVKGANRPRVPRDPWAR
jgi:prevent-host-death family protein